ncbi:RdgB/HAM1 family non-canonical purine NTP pyrophosphatase [Nitrincola tapanii]|uniref:dITP/XTP pyrophosphatase n=1 Tax=Nitrincola tapanii TaxID=1708751 RepID=A0A5A9W331_9GAMM|nr:RdgB/HAM1 family non-canonical purine NTP pyrophosphatase [Nitrincola tapanii]
MRQILLASSNAGKLREFAEMLASEQIEVLPQSAFQVSDAEETGLSFVENAILKARHACAATGLPALADDSGLEVDALQGEPGIYSARYSGPGANDQRNLEHLLKRMEKVPDGQRQARYQCLLVFMRHAQDPTPLICQGSWQGEILRQPQGQGGFGYDPIFWIPALKQTAAELSAEEKHRLSHRGIAMRAFLQLFKQRYL